MHDENSPTWPHVLAFAERMEAKLAKNRHKGDRANWLKDSAFQLYNRLQEEAQEVDIALENGDEDEVADECADVANFAMMIADVVQMNWPRQRDPHGDETHAAYIKAIES